MYPKVRVSYHMIWLNANDVVTITCFDLILHQSESAGARDVSDFTATYLKKHRLSLPVISMQNTDGSAPNPSATSESRPSLFHSLLPNKMKPNVKGQSSKLTKGERSGGKIGERSSKVLKTVTEEDGVVEGDIADDGL